MPADTRGVIARRSSWCKWSGLGPGSAHVGSSRTTRQRSAWRRTLPGTRSSSPWTWRRRACLRYPRITPITRIQIRRRPAPAA